MPASDLLKRGAVKATTSPILLTVWVLIFVQPLIAAPSKDGCTFPPGLQHEITRKYPGRRLVRLADLVKDDKEFFRRDHGDRCPGLVKVNFYGDGKPTWALVLIAPPGAKPKIELVVARQFGQAWEIRSLETVDDDVPVLWRDGPGVYRSVYEDKTLRATNPVIVLCGYESWAIVYAWIGKSVEKVWISD
jgi:hypothetical protein